MPKMKSHSGATKRFRRTRNGKILRRRANANHILGKKTSKRKRRLNAPAQVEHADMKRARRMIGE